MDSQLKNRINFGALVIILISLIIAVVITASHSNISLKREIIIIAQNSTHSVINLGNIIPFAEEKEKLNFLFLGIGGEINPAPNLTDTIIIINSTPRAENSVAISLPRDLLVKVPNKNYYTKINAIYQNDGIESTKNIIKEITGLEIDYYLVLDLESVKNLIDKLGGIDINVEEDIYDPQFPSQNNSFETFSLKKGVQHLDGETALKYIRTRHQPQGDFSRIKRQQQVISALKNKILSLNFIWNFPTILSIWNTLQKHAATNIGLTDIKYAWNLAKKTSLDEINFNTIAPPLVISDTAILGNETASVLVPKAGLDNYEEIKNYINDLIK